MRAAEMLILMPCSDTKRDYACQAREMYQGPMWQTLRTHRGNIDWKNIFVLSGKFGFINAQHHIQTYNARLTPEKAQLLIDRGIYGPNDHYRECQRHGAGTCPADEIRPRAFPHAAPIRLVIIAGAGEYARVFRAFVAELQEMGIVADDADVRQVAGGIGEQRAQLGEWLRQINKPAPTPAPIAPRGRGSRPIAAQLRFDF